MELISCYDSGTYNIEEPVTSVENLEHQLSNDWLGYGVEGLGFEYWQWYKCFLYPNRLWDLTSFIFYGGGGVKITIHVSLVLTFIVSGAVTIIPYSVQRVSSVKTQLIYCQLKWRHVSTHRVIIRPIIEPCLTLWRRIFFFNFSTTVYKMWITQEPKKVALWNKRHFEEKKTESVQHVWNILYVYLLNNI